MLQAANASRFKLRRSTAEKDTLTPFPGLNTSKKEDCLDEHNGPFPADPSMLEDHVVDDRDIEDGENGDKSSHNRPEQELIAPDIVYPLGEVLLRLGLHAEERAAHVDHLPGEEKGKPSEADKGSGAGAEDGVTHVAVCIIAADTKVAVTKAEEDDGEGGKAEGGHPETIDYHVDHDFHREDAGFKRLWRALHDVWSGNFNTETHIRHT